MRPAPPTVPCRFTPAPSNIQDIATGTFILSVRVEIRYSDPIGTDGRTAFIMTFFPFGGGLGGSVCREDPRESGVDREGTRRDRPGGRQTAARGERVKGCPHPLAARPNQFGTLAESSRRRVRQRHTDGLANLYVGPGERVM